MPHPVAPWRAIAEAQEGVLSRRQALAHGLTSAFYGRQVARGQWQRVFPGVVVTHNGPISDRARVWAALLYAGRGAVASHATAAWLDGIYDDPPRLVHVAVPAGRHVTRQPGLRVHICGRLRTAVHPGKTLPRTRVEDTVLDLVDAARDPAQVIDVVLRACQRRLTTPRRLAEAAARRPKLAWRRLLADLLAEAADGVTTPLERCYFRDVERAHGLPRGQRNRPEGTAGRRRYRDVRYRAYGVIAELDGELSHPVEERHRDRARDNDGAERLEVTLRYGWLECTALRCETAGQVARVLQQRGWAGPPCRCGPSCRLP